MIHNLSFLLILAVLLPQLSPSQITEQDTVTSVRYELPAGKKLYYTSRSKFEYTNGVFESRETLEIWVMNRNADGSWHLILRNSETSLTTDDRGVIEASPAATHYAVCEFYPDGRFARNRAMDNISRLDLYLPNLFIILPQDFSGEQLRWEFTDRLYGEKDQYVADKPDTANRSWIVQATHETPLDAIYQMNQKAEIYIDLFKRIPVYAKGESVRGYGRYAGRGTSTVLLDSIVDLDSLQARRHDSELMIFFSADSQYSAIIDRVEGNPGQLMPLRREAQNLLTAAKARITIPEIKTHLIEMIDNLPEDFDYLTEQINKRTKLVNKPSPRWEADDFSGKKHSLDDYRGQVILLDFWYRGCPWCIRAMPMIKRIAEHFKDGGVAIIGVNTDKERADAIFVLQRMSLPYVNLSGRDLIKKYDIASYPTFVIIDKNGLVRRILIGYEPLLDEKLIGIIEPLR